MQEAYGKTYRVGVGVWQDRGPPEEIGLTIHRELGRLGHVADFFRISNGPPPHRDILFFHGPRGSFRHVLESIGPGERRARVIFWNTQGLPDLRLPFPLMKALSRLRIRFSDLTGSSNRALLRLAGTRAFRAINSRMMRFHYLGEYLRCLDKHRIDLLVDASAVYARILSSLPVPLVTVPFGSMAGSYEDLALKRDIDVLWMGKRASTRRSRLIDRLRTRLEKRGVRVHVVDNEENPFVFGPERTVLLNRAKITLNLLRTWYDENSMRFCLAAPNRSMILSETLLPHVPAWVAGRHYVSAPVPRLADTICEYLDDEPRRLQIVDNAYRLATTRLTFAASIRTIMEALEANGHS